MRYLPFIFFVIAQNSFAQAQPKTFINYGQVITIADQSFHSQKIHEVILNPDSTFAFWSFPLSYSCFTWHHYTGTWKQDKDSLLFYDQYIVNENDVRVSYKKNTKQYFNIKFNTDINTVFENKAIKVTYVYDFDAHLTDSEKVFTMADKNSITIPYSDIPNFNMLASVRIEHLLHSGMEKRYAYLTNSTCVNSKQGNIPNMINVEFVENPKKETVYRVTKAVIKNKTLVIVSSSKSTIKLPDYFRDLEFENDFVLQQ